MDRRGHPRLRGAGSLPRARASHHRRAWRGGLRPIGKIRLTIAEIAELLGEDFAELVYRPWVQRRGCSSGGPIAGSRFTTRARRDADP